MNESNNPAAPRQCRTVKELLALFLPDAQRENAASTWNSKKEILERFTRDFGDRVIAELRPFEFKYWLDNNPAFASEWTRRRVIGVIKRVFNWALDYELIDKHPWPRFRSTGMLPAGRKPMSDEDFQTIMRFSPPAYRRFLVFLKFSGCRPGEAAAIKWDNVNWEQRCVILHEHKTARKVGKPRIIPLVPATLKMLAWMRRRRQVSAIGLLERLLRGGPRKGVEVARFMSHYGISDRGTARAREALGVIRERVGGNERKGHYTYRLPDDHVPCGQPAEQEYVFVNCEGNPLNRCSMSCYMARIRRRSGCLLKTSLYALRHRYAFTAIKNGVPLKMLSLILGHANTVMTEHYIDSSGLSSEVQQAAVIASYGAGSYMVEQAKAMPKPIPFTDPGKPHPALEVLPNRYGNGRPRPALPAGLADVPLPSGIITDMTDESVELLLRQLLAKVPGPKRQVLRKPTSSKAEIDPAHEEAYLAYKWAVECRPALANARDEEVFNWLKARPDCTFPLPPLFPSWHRYLGAARHFYGTSKRTIGKRGRPRTIPAEVPGKPVDANTNAA